MMTRDENSPSSPDSGGRSGSRPGALRAGFIASASLVGLMAAGIAGCAEPLFKEDQDRSQYAGYDRARDQTVPPYIEDAYGRRRPNLRGLLLMHD